MYKYSIGQEVIISKMLSKRGNWVSTKPRIAKIVDIKLTRTFGPAYTLEENGKRIRICYWESDIDQAIVDK